MDEILTIVGVILTTVGGIGIANKQNRPHQPVQIPASIVSPAPVPQSTPSTPASTATVQPTTNEQLIRDIHAKVNNYRVSQGKAALSIDSNIQSIAQSGAQSQATANRMSHDGFADRAKAIGNVASAENVATGYQSADAVVDGWISSAGHRANILGSFNRTGIGIAYSSSGVPYYTQLFAQ